MVAGIALGSLSMKTKSIYQGFLVHITVAGMMDWLALSHRNQLPHTFWPAEETARFVRDTATTPPPPVVTEHGVKLFLVLFALLMVAIVAFTRWRAFKRDTKTVATE